ncbi:MAG: hypothetical protein JW966_03700 [Anaerolineae bacterium]|nr:hypothetical protein [Anaerolineae bacterium]
MAVYDLLKRAQPHVMGHQLMTSWTLIRCLTGFWTEMDNPIFWREILHPPMWQQAADRLARATGLLLACGGMTCYLLMKLVLFVGSPLILLMPVIVLWTLLLSLTIGPTVARERQEYSWELLIATPQPLGEILIGKTAGALWRLRHVMRVMSVLLLLLMVVIVGPASLALVVIFDVSGTHVPVCVMCAATIMLPLSMAAAFIADRVQHFVLTVVAALAVSSSASSVRSALVGASVAAFTIWLIDVVVVVMVLALVGPNQSLAAPGHALLAYATLGPTVAYLVVLPLDQMALLIIATLTAREIVVTGLWRWTVRAAHAE